jgi:phosphoribosylformylglycinamidine cyclo-ligase/phosphoribosylamine--glycine ligase/phosphoribosylformylglycinamidine cyclo-ligase
MTPNAPHRSAYAESGVNVDAGNRAVELMTRAVKSTYGPEVLAGIGAFGGLFDASRLKEMRAPVLVGSIDGVGTKVKMAAKAGRYDTIGWDIVNHSVNDILVQGARPLFFMDYLASAVIAPEMIAAVVGGISEACREAGCALLAGETAEMPGVYEGGEFDVAGSIVGIVDREKILPRKDVRPGDVMIGLRSSGPHTNGYSLIRKIFEHVDLSLTPPGLGSTIADALLAPHRSYLPLLAPELDRAECRIKALAHITGGGFFDNIPRILPERVGAAVRMGSWPIPPLFQLIQDRGEIEEEEMHGVFNMGIGMVVIAAAADVEALRASIREETWVIGELTSGERKVSLV